MTSSRNRRKEHGPQDIVRAGLCIGCGSCVAQCGDGGATMRWDRHGHLKPDFGAGPFHLPEAFSRTCPFSPGAADEDQLASALFPSARFGDAGTGRFESAYVGHAAEGELREAGSSGGLVSWVAAELLDRNLVDGVAHVTRASRHGADGRFFRYSISRTTAELRAGAGSRYYPVEMAEILQSIRTTPGRYAVVGIPCFIKAINLLRREEPVFQERIAYTLGLFCGHMKSACFVDSIAWQTGLHSGEVAGIDYRVKSPDRPANWYRARLVLVDGTTREKDWWHLADGDWGAGFFQNSACDYCDDVMAETADIAFGDAWVEPYASDARGSNVVIIRKPELAGILAEAAEAGRISLKGVGAEVLRQTQAAGLRQRREGLAYRLSTNPPAIAIRKRVREGMPRLPMRRRLVYRSRRAIASRSHNVFAGARRVGFPLLYVWWARAALSIYQGLTYSRGAIGRICNGLLGQERGS